MFKRFRKYFIAGVLTVGLVGCDLDTEDQAALTPGTALDNVAGIQSAVMSAYRRLHDFSAFGQQAMLHGDAFADNIAIVNRTGRYENELQNAVGVLANRWTPQGIGSSRYSSINDVNFVLKYIDRINVNTVASTNTVSSQEVLDHLKGEAYFLRALNYFELHRVYAYEPGREVNGFNLGVILRTEPTEARSNADLRERSTNVEGYQLMEQDLLAAINLLLPRAQTTGWPTSLGANTFPFRATKVAAHALLARVYLYWSRWADAEAQATQAITASGLTLTTAANYVASFAQTTHPESIFEAEIRPADWSGVDGPNNSLHSMTMNTTNGAQFVVAGSEELMAAHEAGDVRRNLYTTVTVGGLPRNRTSKWPAEKGSFVENIPIIRLSEMYLIQAEARARQNNDAGAQTSINTLRAARGLGNTSATGAALISLIMNERRVELAFEGHRFYDLKRLGMDIPKPAVAGVPTLSYSDFRILQQIPNDETVLNAKLRQNPGY